MARPFYVRALLGLARGILVVWAVVTVVFFVARVVGDPVTPLLPINATPADIAHVKAAWGLNDPLPVQYAHYLEDAVRFDWGHSIRTGRPAMSEVGSRLPRSMELDGAALAFAFLLGVPLGVIAAVKRGSALDLLARLLALAGQALPSFWLALMLVLLFAVQLHWFPTGGPGGFSHLVLPAISLGAFSAAAVMRLTRSGMLDVLGSDFVRTARAKGLRERTVIYRHALRNALVPVFTVLGLYLGRLIAGAVIVETVFGWPGLGRLLITSIQTADFPVVQAGVLVVSVSIVLVNVSVDLSYGLLDPRIRSGF